MKDNKSDENELFNLIDQAKNNSLITLKKNKIYHVRQENSRHLRGINISNTASFEENSEGIRHTILYFENKENITIDGNGAMIIIHGIMTPLVFRNCKNITIRNLKIDYARPTMNEFKILSGENGIYELDINEECIFTVNDNDLIWKGENKENGEPYWELPYKGKDIISMYFDPKTEYTRFFPLEKGDFRPSVPAFSFIEQIDKNRLKVGLKNETAFFPVGCTVQTRSAVRDQIGGFFERCENISLVDMRIYFMHGLGFVFQFCKNITISSLDCMPKEGRTIACNADFFQFSGCKGDIVIEDCKAAGAHDDFINIHGTHLRIIQVCKKTRSITVRFENAFTWGFPAFSKGDKVDFIKWDTLVPYASTKVKSVKMLNTKELELKLYSLPEKIELNKDVIENTTATPKVIIRKNSFGPSMGRGILTTTRRKVLIENNRFYKLGGCVLLLESDCNFWFESGFTKKVIFKNNSVDCCGYGTDGKCRPVIKVSPVVLKNPAKTFVHGKLHIKNNIFIAAPEERYNMEFHSIRSVYLKENKFEKNMVFYSECIKRLIQRR